MKSIDKHWFLRNVDCVNLLNGLEIHNTNLGVTEGVMWTHLGLSSCTCMHRRTGYFLPGGRGGGKPFAQKIFASFSNFYKTVQQKRGPMRQHRPYRHMEMARYSFSESIPAKLVRKLCRYKQTFGKIATTGVLDKDENLLWSGLQWRRSCHSNEIKRSPLDSHYLLCL